MTDTFQTVAISQMDASLAMMRACIERCPAACWDDSVGRYPFWMVAYHTLCFVDMYLSANAESWEPETGAAGLHPQGIEELNAEFPSRRFEPAELLRYVEKCRIKLHSVIRAETAESLDGPSGFPRLPFSRAELHLYNLRHVAHHTGQMSAFLRRVGVETDWVKRGS